MGATIIDTTSENSNTPNMQKNVVINGHNNIMMLTYSVDSG